MPSILFQAQMLSIVQFQHFTDFSSVLQLHSAKVLGEMEIKGGPPFPACFSVRNLQYRRPV